MKLHNRTLACTLVYIPTERACCTCSQDARANVCSLCPLYITLSCCPRADGTRTRHDVLRRYSRCSLHGRAKLRITGLPQSNVTSHLNAHLVSGLGSENYLILQINKTGAVCTVRDRHTEACPRKSSDSDRRASSLVSVAMAEKHMSM